MKTKAAIFQLVKITQRLFKVISKLPFTLEQFSVECRKTKSKVITTANHNKDKYHNEPMRSK